MKKVYVITAILKENRKCTCTIEIFTDKELAEAYVKYWNNQEEHKWHYFMRELEICKLDYRDYQL